MDHISYSSLALFRTCPRKFFYRYEQNLAKRGPDSLPLIGGYCLHAGTAEWWRTRSLGQALESLRAAWEEKIADVPEGAPLVTPGGKYDYLNLDHLENILLEYAESDHIKGLSLCEELPSSWAGVESVETTEGSGLAEAKLRMELAPDLPPVEFRLDFLGEDEGGRLHLIDRKCKTGWLNEWSIRRSVGVGHQLRLYQTLVQRLIQRPVYATWIEGIYMGAPPKSGWKNVQSQQFGLFGPWVWGEEELSETEEWAWTTLADIEVARERAIGYDDEAQAWAQNDRGNCGWCDFFDLCSIPPSSRPPAILRDYQERRRDDEEENGA